MRHGMAWHCQSMVALPNIVTVFQYSLVADCRLPSCNESWQMLVTALHTLTYTTATVYMPLK